MYRFQLMVKELIGGNYGARVRMKADRFKDMEKLLNDLADGLGERAVTAVCGYKDAS